MAGAILLRLVQAGACLLAAIVVARLAQLAQAALCHQSTQHGVNTYAFVLYILASNGFIYDAGTLKTYVEFAVLVVCQNGKQTKNYTCGHPSTQCTTRNVF